MDRPECCDNGKLMLQWTISGWAVLPDINDLVGPALFPCHMKYCPWCGVLLPIRESLSEAIMKGVVDRDIPTKGTLADLEKYVKSEAEYCKDCHNYHPYGKHDDPELVAARNSPDFWDDKHINGGS